jgi:pimeloyl-ACP methyl ester carboxylesterase
MVLLHGFTDTWRCWTRLLPELEKHHEVLAPTLPGHFESEPIEGLTMDKMADWVERCMDAAGMERAHLVGSSLGGWLAFVLAARGRALSVVAICPAGGTEHGSREQRAEGRIFRTSAFALRHTKPGLLRAMAARPGLRAIALRDMIADPRKVSPTEALRMMEGAAGCTIVGDILRLAAEEQLFGELGEIDVPVRIAYATRDRVIRWPKHYTRFERLLPNAELVDLGPLGHLPMWDDPELVARTVLEVTAPAGEPAQLAGRFSGNGTS